MAFESREAFKHHQETLANHDRAMKEIDGRLLNIVSGPRRVHQPRQKMKEE
jgi:hypothetical protein